MYTNSKIIIGGDGMCTKSELNIITSAVAKKAKRMIGDKLDAVILYGSYARGDYDDESDIDIMVKIKGTRDDLRKYRYDLVDFGSDLSLEHNITVSILLYDTETFDRYRNAMPFLRNVQKDGVHVA